MNFWIFSPSKVFFPMVSISTYEYGRIMTEFRDLPNFPMWWHQNPHSIYVKINCRLRTNVHRMKCASSVAWRWQFYYYLQISSISFLVLSHNGNSKQVKFNLSQPRAALRIHSAPCVDRWTLDTMRQLHNVQLTTSHARFTRSEGQPVRFHLMRTTGQK